MFRLIVTKELREIIASTKFAVTFLVCSLLIILAFYVGARNYQVSMAQYEMAVAENLEQMKAHTDWRTIQNRIFLPPQPLMALVTGISNDVGRNIRVVTRGELAPQDSRFNDDPVFAVFRFLDLDFIFQVVLSLFAILFVYNAVNGEKEQGTLRLTFTNAIPRDTYILGKVTGAFLALGVPLLIPILIGCLLLPLMGIPMTGDDWMRLSLIIVAGLLFLGAFSTLSLFVSTLTHRSSSSFLILLVAWIFAVLIIPRASVLLAGNMVDVISVDEISNQKIHQQYQAWEEEKKNLSNFEGTAASGDNPQEILNELNTFLSEMTDRQEEKRKILADRLEEQRNNEEAVQQRLAFGLARVSPASAFSLAATNLAGSSLELKNHYLEEARRYRDVYARFQQEKSEGDGGIGMIFIRKPGQPEPEPIDPGELPEFQYRQPPLKEVVQASVLDLGILAVFNIVFFAGAFVSFLRYDVR
jgi:ABC-type transport system involved in multi-copper enzyme maturation permease subunit